MSRPMPLRSGNPVLFDDTFRGTHAGYGEEAMTLQGTVNKTALALVVLMAAAAYTWNMGRADPRIAVLMTIGLFGTDPGNAPPTSMAQLTIIAKLKQKAEN